MADSKPTRDHIIDTAFELFIAKGYHGTSMRNIADTAGLAVSGMYNHFSNKEAIFEAIIRRWHPFVRMQPQLEKVEGETVRERLADTIRRVITVYDASPSAYHLLFIELVEFDGKHMPHLFSELENSMQIWVQHLMHVPGELKSHSPDMLFQWLMSVLFAYAMSGRIMPGKLEVNDLISIYIDGILA